jgi:casein kinase II subunit beta
VKGNEFYCEIDEEYILDRFNLTGLNTEVPHYSTAYELITDSLDTDLSDSLRHEVELSSRHLYGLIHARFILTSRGLSKMMEKHKNAEFGRCPRVLCQHHPVLPVGLSDLPGLRSVMLYCPKCEDVYAPPSRRHATIDGAFFGTTFPHLLMQVYPSLAPVRSVERYVPRIFGFKIHASAREQRKQDELREEQNRRLELYQEE